MVHMMGSGKFAAETGAAGLKKTVSVKEEVDESAAVEHWMVPPTKRPRISSFHHQPPCGSEGNAFATLASHYNLLDEPSPLGLRLRKSPSLLDLIQMRLSQENAFNLSTQVKEQPKETAISGSAEKLKASNFPASLVRIGAWEYASRYEGDLVAKCYFAKHKLVWEVLDGGLKNKIEIQWSDIMDIKAHCPNNGPATLNITLNKQPLFFRETNPQPRKHTLWQATSDFTDGEASKHRRHLLQCAQGLLGKHFEKIIQCDPRLNLLSQQPEIVLESPYFETQALVTEDLNDTKCHGLNINYDEGSVFYVLNDGVSSPAQLSLNTGGREQVSSLPKHFSCEASSCSSAIESNAVEKKGRFNTDEQMALNRGYGEPLLLKDRGLHPSMSVSDLMNHIENCFTGERTSASQFVPGNDQPDRGVLEEITHYLFSESQIPPPSDEQSIMSRVNSLCCLLQKDQNMVSNQLARGENGNVSECGAVPLEGKVEGEAMTRRDSVGDLLLSLPRIASFPRCLFNVSDGFDSQAR